MKKALLLLILVPYFLQAQQEYSLPLFIINTEGKQIVDEPKVMATLKVIDNGSNKITDEANEYDGFIGIEFRGSSSQSFPKKPFGFETWDSEGNDIDASFFGWPEEEDWILYPSYNEKSLIHNVLSMRIAQEFGMYSSRTRYVEVFVNGSYEGVYVLMEKIKRDSGRVDINNLKEDENEGEDLTGGYIIKVDKSTGTNIGAWESAYTNPPSPSNRSYYLYEHPSDITTPQKDYIRLYMREFEEVMNSDDFRDSVNGYRKYIDVESFVKFLLVNEISRNIDGYRISTFLHKDKNEKLKAGPVWDFDIAYGNANYCQGNRHDLWAYKFNYLCPDDFWLVPFYWEKLMNDIDFVKAISEEYHGQRVSGFLQTDEMIKMIDEYALEIKDAQRRNFQRWPILGQYVWPQPEPIATTWEGEVTELKQWLTRRLDWLDNNIPKEFNTALGLEENNELDLIAYPNPFVDQINLRFSTKEASIVGIQLYSVDGLKLYSTNLEVAEGRNDINVKLPINLVDQVSLLKMQLKDKVIIKRLVR